MQQQVVDKDGTIWHYSCLDGGCIRLDRCQTSVCHLVIPQKIKNVPVRSIAADACRGLNSVESIVCPDDIYSIDSCAFRECKNLRNLVLPRNLADFDSSWFRQCLKLEQLSLPGQLVCLNPRIFDAYSLRKLHIGAGTCQVQPGTFSKSNLEYISVEKDNEALISDGVALYSKNKEVFVALAVRQKKYEVDKACKIIEEKAFSGFSELKEVVLPDRIEEIANFAYSSTSITSFKSPKNLKVLGEKAFYRCRKLTDITLCNGLESIGNGAFSATGLHALQIPASVAELGNFLAQNTEITFTGKHPSFIIEKDNSSYHSPFEVSELGGLYKHTEEGLHFVQMLDLNAQSYEVSKPCVVIERGAFSYREHLRKVILPEGIVRIERAAFKGCHKLEQVILPETLQSIGDEAFLDTSLTSLVLPANISHIGTMALIVQGAHHAKVPPSLHGLSISGVSKHYSIESDLLCEHLDDGSLKVLLYAGVQKKVTIPKEVKSIASYAFNGARGIQELSLSDSIKDIEICGLHVDCFIEHIHVDLEKPIEGHEFLDIYFPKTERSRHVMPLALGASGFVDLQTMFRYYDDTLVNYHDYGKDEAASTYICNYEQVTKIIARLLDPIMLLARYKKSFERILREGLLEICVDMARHDDRKHLDALIELGQLNRENLLEIIDEVAKLQDAAMTGYLLELKRQHFSGAAIDFEL